MGTLDLGFVFYSNESFHLELERNLLLCLSHMSEDGHRSSSFFFFLFIYKLVNYTFNHLLFHLSVLVLSLFGATC
ncbi:hypothetical protein Hanom_Chr10g00909021 [Helianthus anomalus]